MNIRKKKVLSYAKNITQSINTYNRKIIVLKLIITITNIVFPLIALFLVIISTLNIAGGKYETPIAGDNYIIFSAFISSFIALINSFYSFFSLREKVISYNVIYYKLITEKQKYQLNYDKYKIIKNQQERERLFENKIFKIITGYKGTEIQPQTRIKKDK